MPDQAAVQPPSTLRSTPVIKDARSEARKTAAPAISDGSARRPIGWRGRIRAPVSSESAEEAMMCATIGELVLPGLMQFALIPAAAYCTATWRVIATTAPL